MKYLTTILIYVGLTCLMAYMFNHISPWLGVALAIATFYLAAKQIENKTK